MSTITTTSYSTKTFFSLFCYHPQLHDSLTIHFYMHQLREVTNTITPFFRYIYLPTRHPYITTSSFLHLLYLLSQPLYIYANHFSLYPLPIHPFFVPSTSPTVTTHVAPNRRLAGTRSVSDQTVHCYHSNVPNRKPIKLCFVPYPQLATAYS